MINNTTLPNRKNNLGRPLLLDGAMGSLLHQRGIKSHEHLWTSAANITNMSIVSEIQRLHKSAGADIITTNTFRTNPLAYEKAALDISNKELVMKSVKLALEYKDENTFIAGSNAPAEDCYQNERTISHNKLEYNHKKHIELLMESGCDFVLNETQSHMDEIEIICRYCDDNKIPYVVSLYFDDELKLLSGESVKDAVEIIKGYSPLAISFNCVPTHTIQRIKNTISLNFIWGFYCNLGAGNVNDESIACGVSPDEYINQTKNMIDDKLLFLGACCGSNPEHIKALKRYFER